VLRKLPRAKEDYEACQARLTAAHQTLAIAEAAIVAIEAEEAAAASAAQAAERAKLEAARAQAEKALSGHLSAVESKVAELSGSVGAALTASDTAYNCAVALGLHGNPVATRDRITARIGHVLRL